MKVIATIGPSSEEESRLYKILKYVDGVRLNLKHGTPEEHERRIKLIRKYEEISGKVIPIIGDIPGVEIRTGDFSEIEAKKGESLYIVFEESRASNDKTVIIPFPKVAEFLKEGDRVLIDDGEVGLKITEKVDKYTFLAEVFKPGIIKAKKSVSFPDTEIELSIFENKKNRDLLKFIVQEDIDYIAVSFVQSMLHVLEVKEFVEKMGGDQWIMSKIEHRSALRNLKEIVKASDSIMIARGDLGVEVGLDKLPVIQKKIADFCIRYMKPVYIATQFLHSLIEKPYPTRAEVSDIANAIIDGVDGIILTNETAVGKYPVRAAKIAKKVVINSIKLVYSKPLSEKYIDNVNKIVAEHACHIANKIENSIIVAETETGFTAINITRFKPKRPVVVITNNKRIARNTNILWGVKKVLIDESIINKIVHEEKLRELLKINDKTVVYVGSPILKRKTTMINILQI